MLERKRNALDHGRHSKKLFKAWACAAVYLLWEQRRLASSNAVLSPVIRIPAHLLAAAHPAALMGPQPSAFSLLLLAELTVA